MDLWKTLITSAQLGTEHHPPKLSDSSIDLLDALPADTPEAALLNAITVASVYRRAGVLAESQLVAQPDPAPAETLRPISRGALRHLSEILDDRYKGAMLLEWLDTAAAKAQRIPHPWLPALLDAISARHDDRLIIVMQRTMGERGRWLAAQNPKWKFMASEETVLPDPQTLDKRAKALEADALKALVSDSLLHEPPVEQPLEACQHPWSEPLTDAFIEKFKGAIKHGYATYYVGNHVHKFIPYLHPSALGILRALWVGSYASNTTVTKRLVELVDFRQQMLQDLAHE